MAITVTPTADSLSGIVVPYAMESDPTNSTLGQASPRAGQPVASTATALSLLAVGAQDAGVTVDVQVNTAGSAGQAGAIYRTETGGVADTYWRGQNVPNVLTGFEGVSWDSLLLESSPHAIASDAANEAIAYSARTGLGAVYTLRIMLYDRATNAYTDTSITTPYALTTSYDPQPALCKVPSAAGRFGTDILLCAFWDVDTTTNDGQISIVASRDGGTTWDTWALGVLPDTINVSGGTYYTLGRIRWVAIGSSLALAVHVTASASVGGVKEFVYLYASGDFGASFSQVTTINDAGFPDLVATAISGYIGWVGTDLTVYFAPLPSAWVAPAASSTIDLFGYSEAAIVSGAPAVFSYGSLSLALAPNGTIYAYNVRCVSNKKQGNAASYNIATGTKDTLTVFGPFATRLWFWDGLSTSTEYPEAFSATWWAGQVRLYSTFTSGTATYRNKIGRLDIGGYTTITFPSESGLPTDSTRAAWALTTVPTATSAAYGYTLTGGGTNSVSSNPGWETFTTAATQRYATINPTAATGELWRLWRVRVASGGGVSSRVIMCGLTWDDGVASYSFEVRCSTTQIRFRDEYGAVDGTTKTCGIGSAAGIYILGVVRDDGTASVWYREADAPSDQEFLPLEVGYSLVDGGVGTGLNVETHGNRATGTAASWWVVIGGNEGDALGVATLADGLTLPDDLRGIKLGAEPDYLVAGVSVGWSGGPGATGDSWSIAPDAAYASRNVLPVGTASSSPTTRGGVYPSARAEAAEWRSTATTGLVWFAFPEGLDRALEQGLAVHFEGLNAPTVEVIGYVAGTATTTSIGTHNQSVSGLAMSMIGSTLYPNTAGTFTSTPYFQKNELAGGYAILDNGVVRPIIGNSAGQAAATQTRAVPTIYLDPDSITGSETIASTITIVYPRSTFIAFNAKGTKYAKIGLRWTVAPAIYESYIRARIVAIGPITAMHHARDWGTEYGYEDPADVATMTSGLRFGRRTRIDVRPTLTLNYGPTWMQAPLYNTTTAAPVSYKFSTTSNHLFVGTWGDVANKLAGVWSGVQGSRDPVVFIPGITPGPPNTQSLVGAPYVGFYGRMSEPRITEATAGNVALTPAVAAGSVTFSYEL